MPGRKYDAGKLYRYGFNGKEIDRDLVQYDYGFRIYDPRLVRFKSVDPLAKSYPWYTPYQFAGNSPIKFIDLDGLEPSNNPETPGANEERAIAEVQAINISTKTSNIIQNLFSPGFNDDDLKGRISCSPKSDYISDTKGDPNNEFNMKVSTGVSLNVDESQAKRFNNYEAFVVMKMMDNLTTGEGYENYNFPVNGIMSSKFIGSDVLNDALSNYHRGIIKDGESYQAEFKGRELANDLFKTRSIFSSITGFVGSAQITINKTDANMVKITIFNITSLTSGDLSKEFLGSKSYWPKSYVRHPEIKTRYGNISQTFNLLLPAKTLGL